MNSMAPRVPVAYRLFYDALGAAKQSSRGLLRFRVWQFYDAMVYYVSKRKYDYFVAAAGILAHYLGDACQRLAAPIGGLRAVCML
jgi:hypothetical protein